MCGKGDRRSIRNQAAKNLISSFGEHAELKIGTFE
jgi:hypothetical protein